MVKAAEKYSYLEIKAVKGRKLAISINIYISKSFAIKMVIYVMFIKIK